MKDFVLFLGGMVLAIILTIILAVGVVAGITAAILEIDARLNGPQIVTLWSADGKPIQEWDAAYHFVSRSGCTLWDEHSNRFFVSGNVTIEPKETK